MGKKALRMFAVMMILMLSGVLTTISAIAAELVALPEFEVTADEIVLKEGETKKFNISLFYTKGNSKNTSGKITYDTVYKISGNNISSSGSESVQFGGVEFRHSAKGTVIIENAVPGTYSLNITTVIANTGNGTGNEVVNEIPNTIKVHVMSSDTSAPVVSIMNPVDGGFYKSSALPEEPKFTVSDESATTESITGWSKVEGNHTLTVTSTDAYKNASSASLTYTVDNTPPTITSQLKDGGVYNAESLKDLQNSYYSISESNLGTFTADPLSFDEGEHSVRIYAKDKAGNESEKVISYLIDNEAPSITFVFQDGGHYTSETFQAFNPYYKVVDGNLDNNSVTASEASLAEGAQTVSVTAADQAGNSNSASASYTIDDTKPVIAINLKDGFYYNAASFAEVGEFYTVNDLNLIDTTETGFGSVDGKYAAEVKAQDKAGNVASKTVNYTVDTVSPTISIDAEKLANGGFYQSAYLQKLVEFYTIEDINKDDDSVVVSPFKFENGTHTFTISAEDKAGNKSLETVTYTVDDSAPVIGLNVEDGGFYKSSALPKSFYSASDNNGVPSVVANEFLKTEGTHTVKVTAMDVAGNSTTASVTYTVDDTAPAVSISNPADGGFYKSANLPAQPAFDVKDDHDFTTSIIGWNKETEATHTATVSATDAAGNTGEASVTYTVDDSAPEIGFKLEKGGIYKSKDLPETYYYANDNNKVVSLVGDELNKEEGTHTLKVEAMDAAGNSTTAFVTYTVDDTAPAVSISNPVNGEFYNSADLPDQPVFDVEETHSYKSNIIGYNKDTEAEHTATVFATDAAGNTGEASVTYTVDNTSPAITSVLVDGGYYNAESLKSLGDYYDVTDVNLVNGGVTASELVLTEGKQIAVIIAVDKAGNTSEKTIHYTVDNTKPTISFLFNDKGFYTEDNFKSFDPYYEVEDDNLNEESITDSGVSFTEGKNSLTVDASDLAENTNSATAAYTIDNTNPEVSVSLEEGKYYNLEALEALGQYWSATDANLADVVADPLATTDGAHKATVTAVDKAGNETVVTVNYFVDNTPPAITFDESILKNGGFYTADYLKGLTAKPYSVNDANPASDSASKFVFEEGTHEYTATAKDIAGNETTVTISYTVDNTPPVIQIHVVDNKVYSSDSLIALGQYWSAEDANLADVVADPLATTDGAHKATVTAVDKAGNETVVTVNYIVDNTTPEITFDESILKNGGFYTADYLQGLTDKPYTVADANPGEDSASEFVYKEGTHDYTVKATDKAGNKTAVTISYTVDNTPPEIQFNVIDNKVYTSDALKALGQYYSVSDNYEKVTVDAKPLTLRTDGTYTATVTATDLAGNSTTASVTYTVDDTDPEVTFNLTDGKHYTSASLAEALAGQEYYEATDKHIDSVKADPLKTEEGKHELTVTAVDAAGNETVATLSYIVDNTAPIFSGLTGLYEGQRFLKGQDVNVTPILKDNLDGNINVESVKLDTSKTGKQSITVTATDQAGNSSSYTMSYHVYDFSGILEPLKNDGKSVFQQNRTVPVKFQIFDGSKYVQDATATIHLVKVSNIAGDGEIQVTSTSNASIGNAFRYDVKDEQYIFNMGTKDLEKVQYKAVITITLDGNTIKKESAAFSIK